MPSFLTGPGGAPQRIAVGLGQVGQVQPEDLGEYGEPLRPAGDLDIGGPVAVAPHAQIHHPVGTGGVASADDDVADETESGDVDSVAWL